MLELGATWLHGTDGHPLYELALPAGLMNEPHARPAEQPEAAQTAADAAALVPGGWLMPGGERVSGAELAELRVALQTAERLVDEALAHFDARLGSGWMDDAIVWDPAAGTGNLVATRSFPELLVSTLEETDVGPCGVASERSSSHNARKAS